MHGEAWKTKCQRTKAKFSVVVNVVYMVQQRTSVKRTTLIHANDCINHSVSALEGKVFFQVSF